MSGTFAGAVRRTCPDAALKTLPLATPRLADGSKSPSPSARLYSSNLFARLQVTRPFSVARFKMFACVTTRLPSSSSAAFSPIRKPTANSSIVAARLSATIGIESSDTANFAASPSSRRFTQTSASIRASVRFVDRRHVRNRCTMVAAKNKLGCDETSCRVLTGGLRRQLRPKPPVCMRKNYSAAGPAVQARRRACCRYGGFHHVGAAACNPYDRRPRLREQYLPVSPVFCSTWLCE